MKLSKGEVRYNARCSEVEITLSMSPSDWEQVIAALNGVPQYGAAMLREAYTRGMEIVSDRVTFKLEDHE